MFCGFIQGDNFLLRFPRLVATQKQCACATTRQIERVVSSLRSDKVALEFGAVVALYVERCVKVLDYFDCGWVIRIFWVVFELA